MRKRGEREKRERGKERKNEREKKNSRKKASLGKKKKKVLEGRKGNEKGVNHNKEWEENYDMCFSM